MPRYSQMTPTFTPVSFEQYLKPLEAYVDTYNTLSADVDNTRGIIDTIPQFLDTNNEGDRELINVYNNFQGDIDKVGTAIANGNLKDMMNLARGLKTRYNRELAPIATAYQQKQAAIKAFDERKAKDSSWIGADPRSRSVKDYLNGANPSDFGVSGDALYKDAMTDAAAKSSRNVSVSDWNLSDDLQKQYFLRAVETGFRGDAVDDAIKAITSGSNVTREEAKDVFDYIKNAMGRIGSSYNTQNLSDNDRATANSRILNGIMAGLGYKYTDDHLKNEKDEQYWLNVEGKRLQNQILERQRDALDNTGDSTNDGEGVGYVEHYSVSGDVSKEDEYKELLAGLKAGNIKLDDETGETILSEKYYEDLAQAKKRGESVPGYYNPDYYRKATYADRLYNQGKELGLISPEVSKEEYLKSVTPKSLQDAITKLEDVISDNSKRYRQYYINASTTENMTRVINQANSRFKDNKNRPTNSSLIRKVEKNGTTSPVLEIPKEVTITLPLPSNGTDLIVDELGGDNNSFRVNPHLYNDRPITVNTDNGARVVTLNDLINLYHIYINNGDNDSAAFARNAALNIIKGTSQGMLRQQSKTIPEKDLILAKNNAR